MFIKKIVSKKNYNADNPLYKKKSDFIVNLLKIKKPFFLIMQSIKNSDLMPIIYPKKDTISLVIPKPIFFNNAINI